MLGERLTLLRGRRTQQEIADKLNISRSRYSHYENEHVQPDNDLLQKMADLFACSVDYLLGRTNKRNPDIDEEENEDPFKIFDLLDQYSDEEILKNFSHVGEGVAIDEAKAREFISFARYLKSKSK